MRSRFGILAVAAMAALSLCVAGGSFAQETALAADEQVVTLENGVVGTLLQPASDTPIPAVLMLHGFASQRNEVGDMYTRLAASLAERGIASLRIDFRGWGESAGSMTDSTVGGQVEDAEAAYAYLRTVAGIDAEHIGLIGFSLGGSVAVFAAGENPDAYQSMVLWSSSTGLYDTFIEELGQENFDTAAADGQVTIDLGFREVTLGDGFFTTLNEYDDEAEFARYSGDFLVVAGSEDGSADFLDWFREHAQGALRASFLVDGADHIYNVLTDDQTNSDTVIEKTADWFVMTLH